MRTSWVSSNNKEQNQLKFYGIIPLDVLTEPKGSDIPIIKEIFDEKYKQYYIKELGFDNCYLGCPLTINRLREKEIESFSINHKVKHQMIGCREYLFPVIDKDLIIGDFEASITESGQVEAFVMGKRFPIIYDVLQQNDLTLKDCYLVIPVYGPEFLFSEKGDQEICTNVHPNFNKTLIMKDTNAVIFKERIMLIKEILNSQTYYHNSGVPNAPSFSPAEFYNIWYE